MKFATDQSDLSAALKKVNRFVPKKCQKPILTKVKLESREGAVRITATDLESSIAYTLNGSTEIFEPGATMADSFRLAKLIDKTKGERLMIEGGESLTITSERARFSNPVDKAEDYPALNEPSADLAWIEVETAWLKETIRRTVFATDAESFRYALGGVLFETKGRQLDVVGTDGRRLAHIYKTIDEAESHTAIIPAEFLKKFNSVLDKTAEDTTTIGIAENRVYFRNGNITAQSRLVDGRFPAWTEVFPARESTIIKLGRDAVLEALDLVTVATSDTAKGVDWRFEGGRLALTAESIDNGKAHAELTVNYSGDEPAEVTLDPGYVVDFLKVLPKGSAFSFHHFGADSAAVLEVVDGDRYDRYVIMPMARDI